MEVAKKYNRRKRRHARVRSRISGTAECPRLHVFRSNKHTYAQLIDDTAGNTLAAASDFDVSASASDTNVEIARKVGQEIARRASAAGVSDVVFDRSGFRYHGRVKALAEGAREKGLNM